MADNWEQNWKETEWLERQNALGRGRLVLINSVLSSLPMFMMSFFEIPRGVEKIDCFRSCFYWQNDQHKRKYRLAKWEILCQPKYQGGLGIQNLDIQNKCLLSKWLFKLLNEDGMWQKLLRNKYIKDKTQGSWVKKPTDSHFWKSLMNVKDPFIGYGLFKVKDGSQTRFWFDNWLGNKPLKDRFPALFNIVRKNQDSVQQVLRSSPFNISFRRNLVGVNWRDWHRIVTSLHDVNSPEERDDFVWGLNASGCFTVNSIYAALINNGLECHKIFGKLKFLWKLKFFCGI